MNPDFKRSILTILASSFVGLLFIFAFTWIIFDFQKSSNSLKDTWGIVSSLFGGYTTLVAAYIAAKLLGIWRDQELFNHKRKLHKDGIDTLLKIAELLNSLKHAYSLVTNISKDEKLDLIEESFTVTRNILINYKTDYMNAVEDDKNLMQIYEFCNEYYDFIKIIINDIDNGIHIIEIQRLEKKFSDEVDVFLNSIH